MYKYKKTITLAVTFIIIVLMLSFIFDFPLRKSVSDKSQVPPQLSNQNPPISGNVYATMSIAPSDILVAPQSLFEQKKPIEEIPKAIITVTYTNKTNNDFYDTEVWLSVKGGKNYGYFTTASAKYIERKPFDTISRSEIARFKVPDAKTGQSEKAEIYLYSQVPDSINISAQVKTPLAASPMTQQSTLVIK